MNTQAELERVIQQKAGLDKRREELRRDQNEARLALQTRERELDGELIAGTDVEESIGFIARERVRIAGLVEAEKRLDDLLSEYNAEQARIEREIAIQNYEQEVAENKDKFFECVGLLRQVGAIVSTINFHAPRGYTPPEAELVRNMWERVRNLDIVRQLIDWEYRAPEFMAQARKEQRQ